MPLPEYLLDLPAEEAARLIALALLDRTAEAARRLDDPGDVAAVHDFRVAVRRLRSCLQSYRPEITGSLTAKIWRQLSRLSRITRQSRDLEVGLAWDRQIEPTLGERHRAGLRWHIARLERRRRRADRRLRREAEARFPQFERRLRRRLARYRLRIERDPSCRRHEAAAVLGARIRELAGNLECRLAAVRSLDDAEASHRARIAAKRLRYLLEPLGSEVEGVAPLIERLRALQDVLGDLHDSRAQALAMAGELRVAGREHARRLAEAVARAHRAQPTTELPDDDPRPGLLALTRMLDAREAAAFAQLSAGWLGDTADAFFEAVTAIGKRIGNRPACIVELERRFLLRAVPATAQQFAAAEIDEGWLPGHRMVERVRALRDATPSISYRTARAPTPGMPLAPLGEVDEALFREIWPLTVGRRARRRRHVVPDVGRRWEIDEFLDRELVVAEVAMTEGEEVELPEWLSRYVVREVTGDRDFTRRALAR